MNSLVWMSEEKRAEYDWLKHEQEESKKEKGKAKGKGKSRPLLIFRRTSWGSTRSFWTKAFADLPPLLKKKKYILVAELRFGTVQRRRSLRQRWCI